ncbi:hypothetical protein TNCV_4938231 [Trichonephila clavipes]|nr:hypothetical protein TNCV_4938231 [Trichonephila clavipes]
MNTDTIESCSPTEAQQSSGLHLPTTCPGSISGLDKTDHLIGTSAHAPQRSMVMNPGMDTVGPGPHGLLRRGV